jgi:hypothetical protein
MLTIFFSGEKLAFLDSLPKDQNVDSYYFCSTVLDGIKAGALAETREATLRDFHVHMDNCKVHNSKLTKGKLDEIRLIRIERRSKQSYSICGQEWIPVNFSAYLMNG